MNLNQHSIGLIGAGNMAYFLLEKLSLQMTMHVWNREHSKSLNLFNDYKEIIIHENFEHFIQECDIILLAISDNALADMMIRIATFNKIIIHHSGTYQVPQETGIKKHGVLWPIYSIIKSQVTHYYRRIPIVYQGSDPEIENITSQMADLITDQKFLLDNDQKKYAHLIAVMSNNFINHLIAQCQNLAEEKGIDFNMFHPIIHQTVIQLDTHIPLQQLQSGPARRHDTNTIRTHELLLKNHPDLQRVYTTITQSILKQYNHE